MKTLDERLKAVEVNPYYTITIAELNELFRISEDEVDLITKAFTFGYLQGTKAEKRRYKSERRKYS